MTGGNNCDRRGYNDGVTVLLVATSKLNVL